MEELTPELLEKARMAKNGAELQTIARENGYELPLEDAARYCEILNPAEGKMAEEELDAVSGGCNDYGCNTYCEVLIIMQ